jgi:hypothetical protein
MKNPASKPAESLVTEAQAAWLARWMQAASRKSSMSQRKASAIQGKGGGLAAAAKAAGTDLELLTDDRGVELVAASRQPFKVIA